MINALQTVYLQPKTDNDIATDYVICPVCGSEAVRSKMDNPWITSGRSYNCYHCGADLTVYEDQSINKECFA